MSSDDKDNLIKVQYSEVVFTITTSSLFNSDYSDQELTN